MENSKYSSTGLYILPLWQILYSKAHGNEVQDESFPFSNSLHKHSVSVTSARKLVKLVFENAKETNLTVQKVNCNNFSQSAVSSKLTTDRFQSSLLLKNMQNQKVSKIDPPEKQKYRDDLVFSTNNFPLVTKNRTTYALKSNCAIDNCSPSRFVHAFENHIKSIEHEAAKSSHSVILKSSTKKLNFVNAFGPTVLSLMKGHKNIGKQSTSKCSRRIHIRRHLRKAVNVFYLILKNCACDNMYYLLEVHCPISAYKNLLSKKTQTNQELKQEILQLLDLHTSSYKVFLFLRSVIKQKFPMNTVWGNQHNESAFFNNLKTFLSCRRYDKIMIDDLISNIELSDIPWIAGPHLKESFCKFMKWMMLHFVFILLRKFFYITEHACFRNRLLYFRQEVWAQLILRGSQVIVNKGIWLPLSEQIDSQTQYQVRFCPKAQGLRPIMKSAKNNPHLSLTMISPQEMLKVLQHVCKKYPKILGCSAQSRDDIYFKWKSFWEKCTLRCKYNEKTTLDLYFVKVDVDRCFDTIPVEQLLLIIREIFDRTAHVDIHHLSKGSQRYTRIGDCCDAMYLTLVRSLKSVTLDVMGKKFIKLKGIPQGWCLSSLLCDLFYGNMEIRYLQDFMKSEPTKTDAPLNVLMRYVDDFMFVTSCKATAVEFLRKMQNGFKEYGFRINEKKTVVNFTYKQENDHHQITMLEQNNSFPWFGFSFPTCYVARTARLSHESCSQDAYNNGGVSIDFSRYSRFKTIRDCITVQPSATNYAVFKSLRRSLRLRVAAICFDVKINSSFRVLRNVYELACMAVLQWLAHNLCKPVEYRKAYPGEVVLVVNRLATVVGLSAIRKKVPGQKFPTRAMVLWIFFKAFYKMLLRYQSCYKRICVRLLNGMKIQEKKLPNKNWRHCNRLLQSVTANFPKQLRHLRA